jgi:hypothetical protein
MDVRRRAIGWSGGVAAVAALLAGCTLLISFDDAAPEDGGADADLPIRADGAATPDVSVVDAAGDDAPHDALSELTACVGMANGLYCGNNQIKGYPGPKDDLVTCDGGHVAFVKPCVTGGGCLHMPNPKPDQCDECARKDAGGYYCGRDMYQWSADNANLRVQCQAGAVVDFTSCTTCTSKGSASTCP